MSSEMTWFQPIIKDLNLSLFSGHTSPHLLTSSSVTYFLNKRQLISLVHHTVRRWYSALPGADQTVSAGQTHANLFVSSSVNLIFKAPFNLEHFRPQHTLEKVVMKIRKRKRTKAEERKTRSQCCKTLESVDKMLSGAFPNSTHGNFCAYT